MAIPRPQYETLVGLYRQNLLRVDSRIKVAGVNFKLGQHDLVLRGVREVDDKRIGIFTYDGDVGKETQPLDGAVLLEPRSDNEVAVVPLEVVTSSERVVYFGRRSDGECYRKI